MKNFNPWPMLLKIFGRRAHRTLRRNLPASRLAAVVGVSSAAVASQLASSPKARALVTKGASDAALYATLTAALGSAAALVGIHCVKFDDDDDDDDGGGGGGGGGDGPRGARLPGDGASPWDYLAPAAAVSLASLAASAWAASKAAAPSFQTSFYNCIAGALAHVPNVLRLSADSAAEDTAAAHFSAAS